MAEKSGFFDAHVVNDSYDRVYLAEDFAKYFASFIGNGIFGGRSGELMVSENNVPNMSIVIRTGQGYIEGYFYENTSELALPIDAADGVLNRIDSIVLRKDKLNRVIRAVVKRGTPASYPSAPIIERSADNYELELARVKVSAGVTKITQADITDMRLDLSSCGLVTGVVKQIDTTELGKQLNSYIAQYAAEYRNWLDQFYTNSTKEIEDIKAELEAIAADTDLVKLTGRIEGLEEDAELTNQTLGFVVKNMIPYPYYDTTKSEHDLIWIDNEDGTINVGGATTSNAWFTLVSQNKPLTLPAGEYILSGGNSDCYLQIYSVNGTTVQSLLAEDKDGLGTKFSVLKETKVLIQCAVQAGVTVALIVKPMLRKANIADDTWKPYAVSVKERIDDVAIEDNIEKGCYYRINKETGMKEWLNPPLHPGWFYPLVERWNNKPVFQVTVYAASLPNNSAMVIEVPAEWNQIVSVTGFAYDKDDLTYYPFPVILHSQITPIAVISRVEGNGALVITTNGDATRFEAQFIVKYVRN